MSRGVLLVGREQVTELGLPAKTANQSRGMPRGGAHVVGNVRKQTGPGPMSPVRNWPSLTPLSVERGDS